MDKNRKKTRSLLINYAGYPYTISSFMLDNGLALLAAILHQNGHKTRILDYSTVDMMNTLRPSWMKKWLIHTWNNIMKNSISIGLTTKINLFFINIVLRYYQRRVVNIIYNDVCQFIQKEKIDFIGFKLWHGDGMETTEWIAKKIKKTFPQVKIFAGGPNVDMFIDYIALFTDAFDVLVYGEGDQSILYIAEYVIGKQDINEIPNIIYSEGKSVRKTPMKRCEDINGLPYGDYAEGTYPAMRGDKKIKVISVEESRGCMNKCAFCLHPIKSGCVIRTKNAKVIVDEFEEYWNKYHINVFQFSGSNSPYYVFDEMTDELEKRKMQIEYSAMVCMRINNDDIFKKMKKGGAYALLFGCESGSDKILQKMRKTHNTDIMKKVIRLAHDAGIFTALSFIYPAPFDDESTLKETLSCLRSMEFDSATGTWGVVIPGTPWGNEPEMYNIKPLYKDEAKWIKKIFRWKAAQAYPPALQMKLPYLLNGLNSKECAVEHEKLFNTIREMGYLTTIGSAEALIAKRMGLTSKEMQETVLKALFVGDSRTIQDLIIKHNHYR